MSLHADLVAGRWHTLTLTEQLANIGSEVGRAARARAQGNDQRLGPALDRSLELFDLTLGDDRWRHRLKEIARSREVVCDFLVGDNEYRSSLESLEAYFLPFAMVARRLATVPAVRPTPHARAEAAYLRMLDCVSKRTEGIGDRTIASHWPFIGTDYRRLLIVGQALAGWDDKSSPALWKPGTVMSSEGRAGVLQATRKWASAQPEPITEPLRTRGGKPFWTVSRRVVQALYPDGDGPWFSRYAWWNLFPLGWGDTDKSPWLDALWDAQTPHISELFWGVLDALDPQRVLILAGKAFWWRTAPALGLQDLRPLEFPLIAGGWRDGRLILWTYHPGARVKGHSRDRLAKSIVDAIRTMEPGGSVA